MLVVVIVVVTVPPYSTQKSSKTTAMIGLAIKLLLQSLIAFDSLPTIYLWVSGYTVKKLTVVK